MGLIKRAAYLQTCRCGKYAWIVAGDRRSPQFNTKKLGGVVIEHGVRIDVLSEEEALHLHYELGRSPLPEGEDFDERSLVFVELDAESADAHDETFGHPPPGTNPNWVN